MRPSPSHEPGKPHAATLDVIIQNRCPRLDASCSEAIPHSNRRRRVISSSAVAVLYNLTHPPDTRSHCSRRSIRQTKTLPLQIKDPGSSDKSRPRQTRPCAQDNAAPVLIERRYSPQRKPPLSLCDPQPGRIHRTRLHSPGVDQYQFCAGCTSCMHLRGIVCTQFHARPNTRPDLRNPPNPNGFIHVSYVVSPQRCVLLARFFGHSFLLLCGASGASRVDHARQTSSRRPHARLTAVVTANTPRQLIAVRFAHACRPTLTVTIPAATLSTGSAQLNSVADLASSTRNIAAGSNSYVSGVE